MSKKLLILLISILALTGCSSGQTEVELIADGWVQNPMEQGYVLLEELEEQGYIFQEELPQSVKDECKENVFSADCSSINVENLDQYLNRSDVVYIDLRDYDDYAKKHFKNFEVIPYFALMFNAEAHSDETKVQLYGGVPTDPIAAYDQSDAILNEIFPKDKTIFIMCQSGARVAWMMEILEAKGYDMSKIYNVGGLGQYTDAKYAAHITDTLEFTIDVTYSMEGLTRN
ncbi:Rhodanese domain protein [Alkaliphilus metalliredigens QYMF]|uniref:Rhodanese domain protein n=1 Tax=Alkaliphilus metalliredigens (strain QYMF) TaxID=293826 RepID=A6TX56_ALKMQ|nr:rhodanese-like domain-containing protein [Alkaliphilus metalliredigens]ABR50774.1 Rhodanese domain protein [Alkaliphilus metalliredigens QYMF]